MPDSHLLIYLSLFVVAFCAATILPLQSELVLLSLLVTNLYPWWCLLFVASLGNISGSVLNWWLGIHIEQFKDKKWFPVKPKTLEKIQTRFSRYGYWSLLLSWLPIVGDPLTLVAGVMKVRLTRFLLIVGFSKISRYAAIIALSCKFN